MDAQRRFFQVLGVARAAGLLSVFMVALAGVPEATIADEGCPDREVGCTDDVEECVEMVGEECPPWGGCDYEYRCEPAILYVGCTDYEYMIACKEENPN